VEIEFAVDAPPGPGITPCLYLLQIRPQATHLFDLATELERHDDDEVLCRSPRALGHGSIAELKDIVYVRPDHLDSSTTPAIAGTVGKLNATLQQEHAPYLLIGPGRWGTTDPRLGIPVEWSQIAGARVIVETMFSDRAVEPSQGSHFFHNIASLQIGYLTVDPKDGAFLDTAWLEAQPARFESERVRHIRLERPLSAYIDGRSGNAAVLKPQR
jgi:hypothetical protein